MSFLNGIAHALFALLISIGMVLGLGGVAQPPATPEVVQSTTTPAAIQPTTPPTSASTKVDAIVPTISKQTPAVSTNLIGTAVNLAMLPLGDSKYTTTGAKKGYVYVCHVATGGGGAQVSGSWIHGTTWDSTAKLAVQGSVAWPNATVAISVSGNTRTIASNDLPTNHNTGTFPIASTDPAYQIDRNPSSITPQQVLASLPASPALAATPNCIYGEVGIMTNGVYLYDAFDAEYRDAAAHEEQDSCSGHPNDHGYHYHSLSSCFKDINVDTVIGWAFDGFPITGNALPDGSKLSTADLDECHGITSNIQVGATLTTTYHYVMTQDFPYSVGCFKGKSYEPQPGGGTQMSVQANTGAGDSFGTQGQGQPPQQAIDACSGKALNVSCTVSTPNGTLNGTCKTPPSSTSLACILR